MAENKQERKTFKWGDNEYLLDDLLKLHAQQEQSYYNFARDRGQYDDTALAGLRAAISSRIGAAKSGQTFSADGILDSDKVYNISIQTQKKGLFKKDKYVDQDNTEWAKYYLNKLVGQLKPYQKEEVKDSGAWDISKHGFEAYLAGEHGLNAKDIFQNYDKQDSNNPEAARSFAQRDERLRGYLSGYRDWLKSKNFDFTKNDNEWDDRFMTTLDSLINNTDWSDRTAIAASLRKLGSGEGYATAFTSDKWDLSKSDEELAAERKEKSDDKIQKEQIGKYNQAIGDYWNTYSQLDPRSSQMSAYLGQANSNFYRTPEEILDWSRNTEGVDINKYYQMYENDMMNAEAAQYVLPVLQSNGRLRETSIDGTTYVYDPRSINRNNHSFIAIDPITGKMEQRFLYDIEDEQKQLRNKYLQKQGAARYQIDPDSFKEGGVISMQTGGNFDIMGYLNSLDAQDYEKRAKEKGISAKELKESERTPIGKDTIVDNSKFTTNDVAQMLTMLGNLGTIFMDPVSGGIAGAGLSTADFINDISRDGFQGKDVWNYAKNLGMDALGMIPVVGDTFGTLGKVKKGLFELAPKIIGYVGMLQGVANTPQILDSFSKILDDRDMTTADWQNIANGINLVVSGTRMGKHAIKHNRAMNTEGVKSKDKIQIEVADKEGNRKLLILDGENAAAVKNSDQSVETVNKIVKGLDGYKDYTVMPESRVFGFTLKKPGRTIKDPTTNKETRVWNPFEAKAEKANFDAVIDDVAYNKAYNSGRGSAWAASRAYSSKNREDASGVENIEAFKKRIQQEVDTDYNTSVERATAHGSRVAKYREKVAKQKSDIEASKADVAAKEAAIEAESQTIQSQDELMRNITKWRKNKSKIRVEAELQAAKSRKTSLETEKALLGTATGKKAAKKRAELDARIAEEQAIIDKANQELEANGVSSMRAAKAKHQAAIDSKIKLEADLAALRAELEARTLALPKLERRASRHSKDWRRLTSYPERKESFNGVEYTFKPTGYKTEAELEAAGMFKQGGVFNRNKINKYLEYAKG